MFYRLICFLIFFSWHNQAFSSNILIYSDEGAYFQCIEETFSSVKAEVSSTYEVTKVKADDINDILLSNACLIIFPGGVATCYAQKLNGEKNKLIKEFVQKGGSYLGLCGGAYYAGAHVDFAKGTNNALLKNHELAFFNGIVIGPALRPYDYYSNSGACITKVRVNQQIYHLHYNGGGYFNEAHNMINTSIIASYEDLDNKAAIVKVNVVNGKAILSGVHFEYSLEDHEMNLERKKLLREILTLLNIELKN